MLLSAPLTDCAEINVSTPYYIWNKKRGISKLSHQTCPPLYSDFVSRHPQLNCSAHRLCRSRGSHTSYFESNAAPRRCYRAPCSRLQRSRPKKFRDVSTNLVGKPLGFGGGAGKLYNEIEGIPALAPLRSRTVPKSRFSHLLF
jgi:hypothetical protein